MDPNAVNSWGWFALALVNAGLAEQKNRGRLAWFFISLLLGPFATLYIVATDPPPAIRQPSPPLQLPTAMLVAGIMLMIASGVAAILAFTSEFWAIWVVAGLLAALGVAAFVFFVTKQPRRDDRVSVRDLDKLDQR